MNWHAIKIRWNGDSLAGALGKELPLQDARLARHRRCRARRSSSGEEESGVWFGEKGMRCLREGREGSRPPVRGPNLITWFSRDATLGQHQASARLSLRSHARRSVASRPSPDSVGSFARRRLPLRPKQQLEMLDRATMRARKNYKQTRVRPGAKAKPKLDS